MLLNIDQEYRKETCITCGCVFFFPQTMHTYVKDNKITFFCPSGHTMSYTKSKVDILQEQLEQKEKDLRLATQNIGEKTFKINQLEKQLKAKKKK